MNTVGDILGRLKTELQMVDTSTLFDDTVLIGIISDAHIWAGDQQDWPQLEKAKRSYTASTDGITIDEYYDYPSEFKSDSIYMIDVNGVPYDPKSWDSYRRTKRNSSLGSNERIFATYGRQFFLNPLPGSVGLPIDTWGRIQAPKVDDVNDKTIFSDSEASANEGVMRKALSICLKGSGDSKGSLEEEARASLNLAGAFSRIIARRQRFQERDMPHWEVPDMFATGEQQFTPGNIGGGN